MALQLLLAFALTALTVGLHALGSIEAFAHMARVWRNRKGRGGLLASALKIVRVVSALLLLHLLEAGMWAVSFVLIGALPDIETAVYFSITSYTTVGYGDVVLPAPWRLLGPFEAAVGILMFGWSTAIIIAVISKVYGTRLEMPDAEGGEEKETV